MDCLGIVEETTADGGIVVRCSCLPEIGNPVFDSGKKRLGIVKRIFGPVEEPYASVTPDKGSRTEGLRGKEVYVIRRANNGKDKGRNRRN